MHLGEWEDEGYEVGLDEGVVGWTDYGEAVHRHHPRLK